MDCQTSTVNSLLSNNYTLNILLNLNLKIFNKQGDCCEI